MRPQVVVAALFRPNLTGQAGWDSRPSRAQTLVEHTFVISQSIKGASTTFDYDRNRLTSTTTGGATGSYNYDPYGRLDTVASSSGQIIERNVYDGFDHVVENRKQGAGTTRYSYDPLDRTTTKTTDGARRRRRPPPSPTWACRRRCWMRTWPAS